MTRLRKNTGTSTVEGVVGLWLLTGAVMLGVILMMNVGMATYCKEKLGFVANQAANYAAILPNNPSRHSTVTNMVKSIMSSMGFPTTGTTVSITDTQIVSRPAVKVTISTPFSTFLPKGANGIVPPLINVSDSAVALSNGWYPAYAQVVDLQGQKSLSVIINGTGVLPQDSVPAYLFNYYVPTILNIRL